MELRHLKHFIGVAEELHFGRASSRLNIEQSPLSRSIKELEARLGAKLFERTTRSISLTTAGELFLVEARRVLQAATHARLILERRVANSLRVGVESDVSQALLYHIFNTCGAGERVIHCDAIEFVTADLAWALKTNQADVVISTSRPSVSGCTVKKIWADDVLLVMPLDHPLSGRASMSVDEAKEFPLVIPHPHKCEGSCIQVLNFLGGAGGVANIVEYACSWGLMMTLIAVGRGIGIVPAPNFAGPLRDRLVAIKLITETSKPQMETFISYGATVTPEIAAFISSLITSVNGKGS